MLGFGGGGTGTALGGGAGGSGIVASGGDVNGLAPGNGYKYHTFTTTGAATFTVTNAGTPQSIELFLIGGGGTGSNAGGGAGALIYKTSVPISAQAYPLVIGEGGEDTGASFSGPAGPYPNAEGHDSTAFGYTAAGGGHGGVHNQAGTSGDPGGSGGGGAPRNGGGVAGPGGTASGSSGGGNNTASPNVGWGNNGGNAHASNPGGYGGGGGGAGGQGSGTASGQGGPGLTYGAFLGPLVGVPALPGTYAAGGPKNSTDGASTYPTGQQIHGTGNGGGHNQSAPGPSYHGSHGIVIIRYLE